MTWQFEAERKIYTEQGLFDAFVFQSEFHQAELEPQLEAYGYKPENGHQVSSQLDETYRSLSKYGTT